MRVVRGGAAGPVRVFRSGEAVRPLVRDPVDVARFRREGYWEGFGVMFPPCQCLRCLWAMWHFEAPPT